MAGLAAVLMALITSYGLCSLMGFFIRYFIPTLFIDCQKYVAIHFVRWLRNLCAAIRIHKEHWTTEEARQRSGFQKNTSGLTAEQKKIRYMRKSLRAEWKQSERLVNRLKAAKARGEKKVTLTPAEHRLLKERESGILWKLVQRANKLHGGTVEAKRFSAR